jgi:hypothetical protein
MSYRNNYFFIFFLIFMVACVTPYYPNITKYENLLVVDGQLTNLPGPYKVKLSRTFKYSGDNEALGAGVQPAEPVTGAQVRIIDNTGLEVQLKEINRGEYRTVDTTFCGIPGKSYKLQIKMNDQVYESDFETLKIPTPIDKVYWEYKLQDNEGPKRVQIFLNTHDSTNTTRYYAWEYEETWKFKVPLDDTDKPEWKLCYRNSSSFFLNLGTTTERNKDIIERQPLQSIDESTNRLFIRYTIVAKQYSFTEQTYNYFKDLITLNQNQGTLYDVAPYSLFSNVKNMNNKNVPVLGYFLVAGVSENRIFIDRTELPREFNPTDGFDDCNVNLVLVPKSFTDFRQNNEVDSLMNLGYVVYEKYDDYIGNIPAWLLSLAKPYCFNCTLNGVNKAPEFWTEKNNN